MLLKAEEVAQLLGTTTAVVYSRPWRSRVGLPAVRIGRALRFREEDIASLIQRGVESGSLVVEVNLLQGPGPGAGE